MMNRAAVITAVALTASLSFADDRLSVRVSADGGQIEIGTKGVAAARSHSIRFTIAQPETERWPPALNIAVKDGATGSTWNVPLESRQVAKPHTLTAPEGAYELTFAAPHYRPLRRTVVLGSDTDLGTLTLARYPTIGGSVRSGDGAPVVGAFITDGAKLSAKTDAAGAFVLEVEDEWPRHLQISYPGLASKQLTIPKARTSLKLDTITLVGGGSVAIEVVGTNTDLDVDLVDDSTPNHPRILKSAHAARDVPRVTFEDVSAGEYLVIVRGPGALQKLATRVAAGQATPQQIKVKPLTTTIELRRGDKPVGGTAITVLSEENRWSSEVETDSDGNVAAEAWQRGEYAFAVHTARDAPPLMLIGTIDGASEAKVKLEMPDRALSGRVVDADDGSPLANAQIDVESTNDDGTGGTMTTHTDEGGKFAFDSVRDGSHVLNATAAGHLLSERKTVKVDQGSPRPEVTFRLSRGISRPLRVTWRTGAPVRAAIVVEMINDAVSGIYTTDDAGHTTLQTMADRAAVIYVLPAEGSFAIARLSSRAGAEGDAVVVAEGRATLELRTKDAAGKAIPNVRFVMRYDGEMIPSDVADLLEMRRGISAMTGADGVARLEHLPPGFYELWPVRGRQERNDVQLAPTAAAPVQVAVKDGLNSATMTFAKKR